MVSPSACMEVLRFERVEIFEKVERGRERERAKKKRKVCLMSRSYAVRKRREKEMR